MRSKSLAEIIAALLVKQTMLEAAADEHEDKIELIKLAGKEGATEAEIRIHFESPMDRIPMYATKVVEAAAGATNVPFDKMINHIKTYHELLQAVSEEQVKKEEYRHEDKQTGN